MSNQVIEGMREEPKIDGRSREARSMRGGLRSESEREDVRSDVRSDSVRAAEIRAQEILDSLDGADNFGNELDIPADLAPEGWAYELKRVEVAGKEDRHHQLGLQRMGWTPVPANRDSRHAAYMPVGYDGPIMIKGLMLMEKPKILVERARQAEKKEALDQIRASEDKLRDQPSNTAPRDHPKLENAARHEIMRPIPENDRK